MLVPPISFQPELAIPLMKMSAPGEATAEMSAVARAEPQPIAAANGFCQAAAEVSVLQPLVVLPLASFQAASRPYRPWLSFFSCVPPTASTLGNEDGKLVPP